MDMSAKKTQAQKKTEQLARVARKEKTARELPFDPIAAFGQYKHDGLKLSELPISYVEFLCRPTSEGGDFTHNGVNWALAAKAELVRRQSGGPIPTRAEMPVEDDDIPKPLRGSLARAKTELAELSNEAIDDASMYLLKDFITRRDKSVAFTGWLKAYAQEAARYGVLKGTDVENEWVESILLDYRDHRFEIRVAKSRLTLSRIAPHGKD